MRVTSQMRGACGLRLILLLLGLSLLPGPALQAAEPPVLAVIVPPELAVKRLGATELSLIFLRKKLYWPNGKRMRPANLPILHDLRQRFSLRVLGSLPEAQAEYWNEQYFHGISPPHVVDSQEAMLRYVADTAGAIGYVDACAVDARVSAVAWIDAGGNWLTAPPLCD